MPVYYQRAKDVYAGVDIIMPDQLSREGYLRVQFKSNPGFRWIPRPDPDPDRARPRPRSRVRPTAMQTPCQYIRTCMHIYVYTYPPPRASSRPHPRILASSHPPILALARRFSSRTSPCLMHVPLPMPRVHAPHPAATAPRQTARAPEPRARAHGVHHAITTRHRAPHIRAWGPSRWWYIIYVVHTRG